MPTPRPRRRDLLVAGGLGVLLGAGGMQSARLVQDRRHLPFYDHPASLLPSSPDTPLADREELVWMVDTKEKVLALTFDDGPDERWTPRVLQALEPTGTPATFFLLGDKIPQHGHLHDPDGPHELAVHAMDHSDLGRADQATATAALGGCRDAIEQAYGLTPRLCRPPYGHATAATLVAAASLGLTVTLWSARFRESRFRDHPDGGVQDTIGQVRPGTILLGHDAGQEDRLIAIDRLPDLVGRLRDDGWTFLTVSDLLARRATPTTR